MTKKETAQLLGYLSGLFPAFRATQETVNTWSELLADYAAEEILAATKSLIRRGALDYAPNASKIIGELNLIKSHGKETALEAFDKLRLAFRLRPDQRHTAGTELSQRALKLIGGWSRFAMVTDEHIPFFRKEFVEAFELLDGRIQFEQLTAAEARKLLVKFDPDIKRIK